MGRLTLLAALLPASCGPTREGPASGRPFSWRMVEVETPGGKQLVLEAFDPGPPVIEIRFLGDAPAVGQPAEAEIRLPGSAGVHTLDVFPTRPEVRILGPRQVELFGEGPLRIRFTSDVAGKGGIGVRVRD